MGRAGILEKVVDRVMMSGCEMATLQKEWEVVRKLCQCFETLLRRFSSRVSAAIRYGRLSFASSRLSFLIGFSLSCLLSPSRSVTYQAP